MSGFRTSDVRLITEGLEYPEGPIYQSDGRILLVEIHKGTLTRVQPDGTKQVVANLGGGPNGAAVGPDGAIYVCNDGGMTWLQIPARETWISSTVRIATRGLFPGRRPT